MPPLLWHHMLTPCSCMEFLLGCCQDWAAHKLQLHPGILHTPHSPLSRPVSLPALSPPESWPLQVWEETLLHLHARADSWVWCDDEEEGQPAVSMVSSPRQQPEASLKPRPDHSKAAKVGGTCVLGVAVCGSGAGLGVCFCGAACGHPPLGPCWSRGSSLHQFPPVAVCQQHWWCSSLLTVTDRVWGE